MILPKEVHKMSGRERVRGVLMKYNGGDKPKKRGNVKLIDFTDEELLLYKKLMYDHFGIVVRIHARDSGGFGPLSKVDSNRRSYIKERVAGALHPEPPKTGVYSCPDSTTKV